MKLYEAKELIRDVFEHSFEKNRYTYFIKNLLKDIEEKPFTYTGSYIPNQFENYIRKLERVGKYEDADSSSIEILIVELKRDRSIEYARSTQRNFIRWYLAGSRGGQMKDAALVAFYSEKSLDWRFSLIKMQYSLETKKDEFTPAKRFSFLVGEEGKSHTAQQQLVKLLKTDDTPLLSDLEEAFNIETVTNEFFEKYKGLVFDLVESLEFIISKDSTVEDEFKAKAIFPIDFAKKLMGQIVFLYFLQRKGWLGLQKGQEYGEGDRNFLRSLYNMKKSNENFLNDYLEYLFYDALNNNKRSTDFYSRFNCKIPFLNGGLFDPIGFYDWQKTNLNLLDEIFANNEKTPEGDIGSGILDIFDRYNFTVNEAEPLEKEVAVDPEMLGKVFERMLEVNERKSKGAFYTPREIVHYMSQESLIHYLDTVLNDSVKFYQRLGEDQTDVLGNKAARQTTLEVEHKGVNVPTEDIEILIKHGDQFIDKDTAILEGRLKESSNDFQLPESIRNNVKIIDEKLRNIRVCDPAVGSGAFPVGVMTEIVKARQILDRFIDDNQDRSSYALKSHCIHHSLYGVDIDASAVEICKLRLWLSLVVDEERIDIIEPLPNLDYKIVRGNSLLGYPYNPMGLDEIESLKEEYFIETDKKNKKELKEIIDSKIYLLFKNTEKSLGYKVDFDFKVNFSEVLKDSSGFDVVIGNPPYVAGKDLTISFKNIVKRIYEYQTGKFDLFLTFLEKSLDVKSKNSCVIFIIPNTFLVNENATLLRKILVDRKKIYKLRTYKDQVFDASVENIIIHINNNSSNFIQCLDEREKLFRELPFDEIQRDSFYRLQISINEQDINIINKIENKSIDLGSITDMCIGIQLGGSGDSKVFKKKYITKIAKNSNYKKVLDGKEYEPFKISWSGKYIHYGKWLHRKRDEKYFINPKLMIRQIGKVPVINIDTEGYYTLNTIYNIISLNNNYSLRMLFVIINSIVIKYYWLKKFSDSKTLFPKIKKSQLINIPIKECISPDFNNVIDILVDYLLFLKSAKLKIKQILILYFEQLLDGIVFELYFEDEIKNTGQDVLKHLTNLYSITGEMSDEQKMKTITQTYKELNDSNHPIYKNLIGMDEIKEVRIIKGIDN